MKKFDEENIAHPLTTIKTKIENYSTFAGFLDDIKWATHKCMVVYNGKNYFLLYKFQNGQWERSAADEG